MTRPDRMFRPDLLGVVLLGGLVAWVTRAVIVLGAHGSVVVHASRVVRT